MDDLQRDVVRFRSRLSAYFVIPVNWINSKESSCRELKEKQTDILYNYYKKRKHS